MKTILNISWDHQTSFPRTPSREIPLVANESFGLRGGRSPGDRLPDDLLSLLSTAAGQPRALVSSAGLMCLMTLLLDDGSLAKVTTDGELAVLQDWFTPRQSAQALDPKTAFVESLRALIVRHADFDADAKSMTTPPPAADPEHRPVSFAHPELWGFKQSSGGQKWENPTSRIEMTMPPASTKMIRPRTLDLFDTPSPPNRGDPLHLTAHFRTVRQSLNKNECYQLALSLGRCRLFGSAMEEGLDCTLAVFAAERAADEAITSLQKLNADIAARDTANRESVYRTQDAWLELLEARMDVWALFLALDESYMTAMVEGDSAAQSLGKRLTAVMDQIEQYDGNLRDRAARLRPAASTRILANWRRLLAPAYRELLPWWLSGEIE